jgi:hypothetical protein
MTLASAILRVALALPGIYYSPGDTRAPTAEQRRAFLATVAYAISSAAERATCSGPWQEADATICRRTWHGAPDELAAILLAIGYDESRLDERVAAGLCPVYVACSRSNLRARSIFEIEHSEAVDNDAWRQLVGVEVVPVSEAAWTAARIVVLSRGQCGHGRDWLEGTLSAYARGMHCSWSRAPQRASLVVALLYRVRAWRASHRTD